MTFSSLGVVFSSEFASRDGEHQSRLIVLFLRIFDVARTAEDLQRGVYHDGKMVEGVTELVDVELEGVVVAGTDANLIEKGQMFVDLTDIVFLREGVNNAFLEFALVTVVIEQHRVRAFAVTSCTACLLEIGLDAVWAVDMDNQPYIGFVDAHTEGVGGHHHADPAFLPSLLPFIFHTRVETGVIERGGDTSLREQFGIFLRTLTAAGIDDGGAWHAAEDMDELFALVVRLPHDVDEVLALEAHTEDVEGGFSGFSR